MTDKKKNELSPVMRQYVEMKREVPDALLLFRLGDFYEAFFNDAKIIAKAIDIVLTKRGFDTEGNKIPMCGIPAHAFDSYMGKLVKRGFRVAIADQMETPEQAKARGAKQINREIVRVVTPGTLTDESLLSAEKSNMLMSVIASETGGDWWVAACDISTGEFLIGSANMDIMEVVAKINPAEVIMHEDFSESGEAVRIKKSWTLNFVHKGISDRSDSDEIRKKIFGRRSVDNPAVDLLAVYLNQTQRGAGLVFQEAKDMNKGKVMSIDASSFESLEIEKAMRADGASLLSIIDHTETSMGARKFKSWLRNIPMEVRDITQRQDTVEFLLENNKVRGEIGSLLGAAPDIARSMSRLIAGRGMPRDLVAAKVFLALVVRFKTVCSSMPLEISDRFEKLSNFGALRALLEQAIDDEVPAYFRDGGVIKTGFNQALDHLRGVEGNAKKMITALQKSYVDKTGVATLKIKFTNMLGYFVEIPSKYAQPFMAFDSGFIHRQTISNNMRFTTGELANLDQEIRTSGDKASNLEQELVNDIVAEIKSESDAIADASNLVAELDVLVSLAEAADKFEWVRPEIKEEPVLDIAEGRHPVVESIMRAKALQFVPNDCVLLGPDIYAARGEDSAKEKRINVITGPNMAGKSTYLRQNALIVILAHLGSFVPAKNAVVGLCDRLFSRVGASDNLAQGQSTFMVEMHETANILKFATRHSFVILDEIGRGTATWDGMAIAQATLEFLDELAPRTLFATHYHELTELKLQSVKFSTMQVKEHNGEIAFMYKVVSDSLGKSYGIHVAKLAGMPESVVARAEEILKGLEGGSKSKKQLSLF